MDFKGSQFERDIILWGVRWYVAYPISYRQLEEMMQERGVEVDHSSLNRWVCKQRSKNVTAEAGLISRKSRKSRNKSVPIQSL